MCKVKLQIRIYKQKIRIKRPLKWPLKFRFFSFLQGQLKIFSTFASIAPTAATSAAVSMSAGQVQMRWGWTQQIRAFRQTDCLTISNTPSNTHLYIHMHTPDFPEHVQSRAALRPTRVLHRCDCLWWIYTTQIKKKLTLMSCMCLNKTQDVCYKLLC